MKNIILLIYLLFTTTSFAQIPKFYLKLNAIDCSTCVNGMTQLKNKLNKENSLIVIQKKYKRDSISIEKKFLLSEYNLKIIWSDSFYKKISKNEKTELVIVQDNKENINLLLTQIDYKNLFNTENNLKDSICGIMLPSIVKIKEKGNKLGIKNYVSGEIYIYAKNGNIDTFYAPNIITRKYKLQLFDTSKMIWILILIAKLLINRLI